MMIPAQELKRKIKHECILIIIVGILLFFSYGMLKVFYEDLQYFMSDKNTAGVISCSLGLLCCVVTATCSLFVFYNATRLIFHTPVNFDPHPEHTMD